MEPNAAKINFSPLESFLAVSNVEPNIALCNILALFLAGWTSCFVFWFLGFGLADIGVILSFKGCIGYLIVVAVVVSSQDELLLVLSNSGYCGTIAF